MNTPQDNASIIDSWYLVKKYDEFESAGMLLRSDMLTACERELAAYLKLLTRLEDPIIEFPPLSRIVSAWLSDDGALLCIMRAKDLPSDRVWTYASNLNMEEIAVLLRLILQEKGQRELDNASEKSVS